MSLAIPGLTLFVYFTMLGPMVQTLEEVKSAMCLMARPPRQTRALDPREDPRSGKKK